MSQKTEKIFERAKVNLDEENHENALRLLNEVLNREPSHKKALRNKGLIKILKASFEEAEDFLLFAIEQQPQDDQLYQMLGTLYHNHEQPSKALEQFKKAVEINSANGIAHQGLGMIYAHIFGEHDQAITHFTNAIKENNNKADVFFNRACSYMITEEHSKAEEDFRKAGEMGHEKSREMIKKYFN